MFDKPFQLEIIAPDRVIYRDGAVGVSAPGVEGGFQVLFNHAPLVSALEVGRITVKNSDGRDIFFATSGGFLEVRDNTVVALVDSAERADEIDVARAKAARERAERRLREPYGTIDIERARASLLRAINRLRIATKS